ncbi:hypothetical protein LOZ36_004048 [Ophidiomyces ophidiicola]|nr:hypothetical protein LOZ36_004048 [Ophidiomyces ophidiicola]
MTEEIATTNAEASGEYDSCQLPFYKPWEAEVIGWGCSGRVYRFDENVFPGGKNYAMEFLVMNPARPGELENEIYARFPDRRISSQASPNQGFTCDIDDPKCVFFLGEGNTGHIRCIHLDWVSITRAGILSVVVQSEIDVVGLPRNEVGPQAKQNYEPRQQKNTQKEPTNQDRDPRFFSPSNLSVMNGAHHPILNANSALDLDLTGAIPAHPLGVKPSGNGLTASWNLRASIGHFGILPDELISLLLESLDEKALRAVGATCKALHAFTRSEDLWKTLFIETSPSDFIWRGTWRSTYLSLPDSKVASPDCSHLFSDALHRPFYCAHISLSPYTENIPARNQISRLGNLTSTEFDDSWADRPFILTEPVKTWPVYKTWSIETLLKQYDKTLFRAEAVDWPLRTYVDYMNNNSDESPLYLFDRSFVSKMGLDTDGENAAFLPPACFGRDLFSVLGAQRPDKEWLIIGPERSGSTFHKDPNATSAWNAVITGSKYWIMFPSSSCLPPPPGVYVSADQSEVTSPLSIAEWLLNFHAAARKVHGCIEGICEAGEVLHVPSGWWHLVVNLSPSIAITQNFVPRKHLGAALEFLRYKADQVSGFKKDVEDPYGIFIQRMHESYPDLLERAIKEMESKKKRKWDEIVRTSEEDLDDRNGGFSFGFGDEGSDVEVP